MFDKDGKVFGKINIIDLLVILAIIVGLAAVVISRIDLNAPVEEQTLIMKYYIEEVRDNIAESLEVGDILHDSSWDVDLGVCTDIELSDSQTFALLNDGTYALTSRDGFYSVIVTGEVKGRKTDIGAEISKKKYGVGHSFVLLVGDAAIYLRVYDIQVKE